MRTTLRRIGLAAGIVALLALILVGYWLWFTRRAFPQTTGTIALKGLKQPVEIYRDTYGVAHIYAQTPEDLFFAEGYTHAQERFWEMEFQRRVGSGRLSEILGSATLDTDIYIRTLGYRHYAEQEYAQLNPEAKTIFDAYSAGVNAYISNRKPEELGLEFAILGLRGVKFSIEPWTPVDSLVWLHMMIYDQSDKMSLELRNLDALRAVGAAMAADLVPPYRPGRPVIVPDAELPSARKPAFLAGLSPAETAAVINLSGGLAGRVQPAALAAYLSPMHNGSNSWVVSGKLTSTGKPLLANDPHMSFQMPSLWYEVDMHCVKKSDACPWNIQGFSLPGAPGILLGHNDRIAWALTNAYFDSQDVFVERINPANPNQYEVNGKWVDMTLRREEIKVLGQDQPVVLQVRSTRHGPVISDHLKPEGASYTVGENGPEILALSLESTDLGPIHTVEALVKLNRAQNWEDFREALKQFDAGTQNVLYADVDGNIGYQLPGLIPIRVNGDGSLPVPGWNDDYEWSGFIPYDQLPREYNPQQGFIAAPNNPETTSKYPYLLTTDIDYGYRAQRIVDLIAGHQGKLTIDDMRAIQRDTLSLPAQEVIPYLKGLTFNDSQVAAARDRLLKWDGQMTASSPDAALYNYFWDELLKDVFRDQLPQNLWPDGGARFSEVIYHLLQDEKNPWWDDITTPAQETRDDILARAFAAAYARGVKDQGVDLAGWQWGKMHTIVFKNRVLGNSGISLIESIFNRGPYPVSGSQTVVDKVTWDASEGFTASSAPAVRAIYDLSDFNQSLLIYSGGQSGHPYHAHYDDFIQKWLNFDYNTALWDRSQVEATSPEHLTLLPGS